MKYKINKDHVNIFGINLPLSHLFRRAARCTLASKFCFSCIRISCKVGFSFNIRTLAGSSI